MNEQEQHSEEQHIEGASEQDDVLPDDVLPATSEIRNLVKQMLSLLTSQVLLAPGAPAGPSTLGLLAQLGANKETTSIASGDTSLPGLPGVTANQLLELINLGTAVLPRLEQLPLLQVALQVLSGSTPLQVAIGELESPALGSTLDALSVHLVGLLAEQQSESGRPELGYELAELALAACERLAVPGLHNEYLLLLARLLDDLPAALVDPVSLRERRLVIWSAVLPLLEARQGPLVAATLRNMLGAVYTTRSLGDLLENIAQAIAYSSQALRVFSRESTPYEFAAAQTNLGNAYFQRATLSSGTETAVDDQEQALTCYQQALLVFGPQTYPKEYTGTLSNLGYLYQRRQRGDPTENIEHSIQCFTRMLAVVTLETAPTGFALAHGNLGNLYSHLERGDSQENLHRAAGHYEEALRVFTQESNPAEYAALHANLAQIYRRFTSADHLVDLQEAANHYAEALAVDEILGKLGASAFDPDTLAWVRGGYLDVTAELAAFGIG